MSPNNRKRSVASAVGIGVAIIGGFAILMFVMRSPLLLEFRKTLVFKILFLSALTAGLLLAAFLPPHCRRLRSKICLPLCAAFLWIAVFLIPFRLCAFFLLAVGIALCAAEGAVALWRYFRREEAEAETCMWVVGVLFIVEAMMFYSDATFLSGFPFWLPSVIAAGVALAAGGVVLFVFRARIFADGTKIANKVFYALVPLLVAVAAFFFVWVLCGVCNFAFDKTDPEPCACTVIDKRIVSGARTPTQFSLRLAYDDGEFSLNVSESDYHGIEIGEEITVGLYGGAFGEAYYYYDGEPTDGEEARNNEQFGMRNS